MSQPLLMLSVFIFFVALFILVIWSCIYWYRNKLTVHQKDSLSAVSTGVFYAAMLFIFGGVSAYAFERYYEAEFINNGNYDRAGKIGASYLNEHFVEGSPACKSIQAARAVPHVSYANDKKYCFYLYNQEVQLFPFRAKEDKTEILLQTLPWPKILEVDRDLFSK